MSHKNDFASTLPGTGAAPTRIGNYEVMGVLGRGQSATIYLGRELFPAREVQQRGLRVGAPGLSD